MFLVLPQSVILDDLISPLLYVNAALFAGTLRIRVHQVKIALLGSETCRVRGTLRPTARGAKPWSESWGL